MKWFWLSHKPRLPLHIYLFNENIFPIKGTKTVIKLKQENERLICVFIIFIHLKKTILIKNFLFNII